jgi:hypothetical protein
MLWQPGQLTNQQIGEKFGVIYSTVRRRVGVFKDLLIKNSGLQNKQNRVYSLIKGMFPEDNFTDEDILERYVDFYGISHFASSPVLSHSNRALRFPNTCKTSQSIESIRQAMAMKF